LLRDTVQTVATDGRTDGRRWRDKIALASTALTASDGKIVNKTKTNIIIIIIIVIKVTILFNVK